MTNAHIIDACRTPRGIGKVGKGKLVHLRPQHPAATVLKALQQIHPKSDRLLVLPRENHLRGRLLRRAASCRLRTSHGCH